MATANVIGDVVNTEQKQQIEDYRPGYPQFSALIGSHSTFHIWRRFLRIRARLLLLKQDELSLLESQLDQVDREEERELFLGNARRDNNPERKAVLAKIEIALDDYDELLSRNLKILTLDNPNRDDLTNLQNWVDNTRSMPEEEIAYLSHTKDLATIHFPKDYVLDRLTPFSERIMSRIYKLCRKPQCDVSRDPNITILPAPPLQKLSRLLFAWLVIILLLIPVVIINAMTSTAARLAVIFVVSTVFVTAVTCWMNAKAVEVVLFGATYAAVLVVFISNH